MPTNVEALKGAFSPKGRTELDELDRDILLRQSRLLYPDVEDWILNMSIEAYLSSEERAPKGLKSLGKEEEEEEPKPEPNVSKQCDDEICVSCGS